MNTPTCKDGAAVKLPRRKATWEMSATELARVVADFKGIHAHRGGGGWLYNRFERPVTQGWANYADVLVRNRQIVVGKGVNWSRVGVGSVKRLALLVAPLLVLALASPALAAGTGIDSFQAPAKKTANVERRMDRPFDAFSVYDNLDAAADYPNAGAQAAIDRGAVIYLNLTSMTARVDGVKAPYCWADVAAGRHDDLIRQWVTAIKATGYMNLVVTFQHEAEVIDSPRQPKCPGSTPAVYRAAFHRVHWVFRTAGIRAPFAWDAVALHWNPALGFAVLRYAPWGWFDVLSLDQYDHAVTFTDPAFKLHWFLDWYRAKGRGLPVMFGELGIDSNGPESGAMVHAWADYLRENLGDHLLFVDWNFLRPYTVWTDEAQRAFLEVTREPFWGGR